MDSRHPPAEVHIDEALVRALLRDQHPDLAEETLRHIDTGWDNVTYQLGAERAVRVPRREAAVALILNEQQWLPVLAPRLSVPIPVPDRLGVPSDRFAWPWSVVRWIDGATADHDPLDANGAAHMARVLLELHTTAPEAAPPNPFRGIPLEVRADFAEDRIATAPELSTADRDQLREYWRVGADAARARERVWLHGDLHPRNVLVRNGSLAGLLDWGDVTAGDRATDLACAWMLFDADGRARFHEEYGASRSARLRGRAWAVFFGTALSTSGEPRHERIGQRIVHELLGEQRI